MLNEQARDEVGDEGAPAPAVVTPRTPDELLTTTRAVRRRLDLERPVPRHLVEDCVRVATQAPSGSNVQSWAWLLVDDSEQKLQLAQIYREAFFGRAKPDPGDPTAPSRFRQVLESAVHLAENMHRVPVLVVPCVRGRLLDRPSRQAQASHWGSILPATWSFMLAARARGLGTCYTTLHLADERRAAEILGLPYTEYAQAGLVPVAYTSGAFRAADRSLDGKLAWNSWSGRREQRHGAGGRGD